MLTPQPLPPSRRYYSPECSTLCYVGTSLAATLFNDRHVLIAALACGCETALRWFDCMLGTNAVVGLAMSVALHRTLFAVRSRLAECKEAGMAINKNVELIQTTRQSICCTWSLLAVSWQTTRLEDPLVEVSQLLPPNCFSNFARLRVTYSKRHLSTVGIREIE
jgi:hypothetical protein